jgi:hypothetical protein
MKKLLIETKYTIFGDEGDMFNEVTATTEHDIDSEDTLKSILEIHEEKVGKIESTVRVQLKDLLNE